ncbi:MAG: type VI secretion system protein TssA [Planctomycetaceae bacterium]|nr:MAG: type VI secretion system protein TssA [Planctomycetaceae bacterium]
MGPKVGLVGLQDQWHRGALWMVELDIEQLLEPISPDQPCGADLEYDADFGELERAAQPVAAQEIGESVVEGQEPDWRAVAGMARDLLERTKDLRVAVLLARALLYTQGLPGFCQGLAVLRGLVERYWDEVHPQLDPDDDLDPTLRVNTLINLCDYESCLRALHAAPLIFSDVIGPVTYRDYMLAIGEISPREDEQPREMSDIEGVLLNEDIEKIQQQAEVLRRALDDTGAIEDAVTAAVGAGRSASLEPLQSPLMKMHRLLEKYLDQRGVESDEDGDEEEDEFAAADFDDDETDSPVNRRSSSRSSSSGEIRNREDVLRMLDKICEFYEKHEPSSPVPLLLKRAKRVATMTFLELLRELTPAGVEQAEAIGGVPEEGY